MPTNPSATPSACAAVDASTRSPAGRLSLLCVLAGALWACGSAPASGEAGATGAPDGVASTDDTPASDANEAVAARLAVAGSAAQDASPAAPDLEGWHVSQGYHGWYSLAWRPAGEHERLPRNVEFTMDVALHDDGVPITGATLHVTAAMPSHGHGMVQLPRVEELGDGRYRVDGMLLHMRGAWQLRFAVVIDRQAETFFFDVEV